VVLRISTTFEIKWIGIRAPNNTKFFMGTWIYVMVENFQINAG
jgi:hypothetical protein